MIDNLTIIIPYRDGHATIGRLLASIPQGLPVIVVDDCSERPLGFPRTIRLKKRGYFSGAVNAGIQACDTDVLILNQDAWLEGETWQAQVRGWQNGGYAIAGDGVMKHPAWPKGYVQGTCMYMSRAAINKVGLFNEVDYPLWGATAEWQLRACRLGFKALPCAVGGFHHERKGNFGSAIAQTLSDEPDRKDLLVRTPPIITVVTACHNYGRYLPDAVHSLLGGPTCLGDFPPQTFQSFEIIIVDDASTDDSWQIAQSLADDWKGVRAIRNPKNIGTAATYNIGVKASFGKYLTMLSADDMMEPTRLEILYRAALANPHMVVYDNMMLFKNGERFERFGGKDGIARYDFEKTLVKNSMHAGIFYERRAWDECNGYPEIMRDGREDWAFNVALGARGYCGVWLEDTLYLYRREGQNRSVHNTSVQWYQTYRARMEALFPDLYRGERPPMCCGSGSKKKVTKIRGGGTAMNAQSLPIGSEGMTLLEYIGQQGPHTIMATDPHQTYVAGGKYHFIYVDNRHVAQMLDKMEGRKPMFKRGVMPKPHLSEPQPTIEQKQPVEPVSDSVITIDTRDGISAVEASQAGKVLAEYEPEQSAEKPKRYSRKKSDD